MEDLRENELVERFRSGIKSEREAAFEELYSRLGPGLHQVCRRMFGSTGDAEDAFQETLLAIYRALPNFRGDARLATWAYRIAVRTCLHDKRKRQRHAAESLESEPLAKPDQSSEERELAQQFDRAVAALRPAYRAVFSLCCVEGLSQVDVASILGIPEGTVWTRLHRARQELAALAESGPNPSSA